MFLEVSLFWNPLFLVSSAPQLGIWNNHHRNSCLLHSLHSMRHGLLKLCYTLHDYLHRCISIVLNLEFTSLKTCNLYVLLSAYEYNELLLELFVKSLYTVFMYTCIQVGATNSLTYFK